MNFFSKSIKLKIIGLVSFTLLLSQLISFFVTYFNIDESQQRNLNDSFTRTQQVFKTLVNNEKLKLLSQVKLIGTLPILLAVVDSEDEETMLDTIKEYQKDLDLEYIDLFDIEGSHLIGLSESSKSFKEGEGQKLATTGLEGRSISTFVFRDGKLSILATSSIGSEDSSSGAIVLGNSVDSNFSKMIKNLTNSDITFLVEDKIVSSSLPDKLQRELIENLKLHKGEQSFKNSDYLFKTFPIQDISGKRIGTMVLEASLKSSKVFFKKLILIITGIMLIVFVLFLFAGVKISKNIIKPIVLLKNSAHKIETSLDYSIRAPEIGKDEVFELSQMFNRLLDEIQKNHKELKEYSKNLESKVEERTKELSASKDRITTLLNNLDQGFMVFSKDGVIEEGSSKAASDIFSIEPEGKSFYEVLGEGDSAQKDKILEWVDLMYQDSLLDFDSLADIGPGSFTKKEGKFIKLDYRPIFKDGSDEELEKIICIASDKTEEERFKKIAEKEQATVKLVMAVLDDKSAFLDFISEAKKIISKLEEHLNLPENEIDLDYLFRYMHTIKGGGASFHFIDVAKVSHKLENLLAELKGKTREELINELPNLKEGTIKVKSEFFKTLEDFKDIIGDTEGDQIETLNISKDQLREIYQNLLTELGEGSKVVGEFREKLILEDFASAFNRYEKVVKKVAEDQGKDVNFLVDNEPIPVEISHYKGLITSAVHIFRNAVDHGIEDIMTREMVGKNPQATLNIKFKVIDDLIEINVEDDGQGIDTDKVARLAVEKELITQSEVSSMDDNEKNQLIFKAGFSTKEEVTDLSGRGVGLDSVLYEAKKLGGSVTAISESLKGSKIIIKVPRITSLS